MKNLNVNQVNNVYVQCTCNLLFICLIFVYNISSNDTLWIYIFQILMFIPMLAINSDIFNFNLLAFF
jgi:uncharacterized protein YqhQ